MEPLQLALLLTLGCLASLSAARRLNFLALEFRSPARRLSAACLLALILAITVFYPAAANDGGTDVDTSAIPFPTLFAGHFLLVTFLLVWWRLRGDTSLRNFLHLGSFRAADLRAGLSTAALGWLSAIAVSAAATAITAWMGAIPEDTAMPPLMLWVVRLSLAQKLLVIAAAMTCEEAFFRAFLQPRVGLVASSLLFALAHASYGLPVMVLSIFALSLLIGRTFRDTGRLLPCVIAHGAFDAVQLLVVLPLALRTLEHGHALPLAG